MINIIYTRTNKNSAHQPANLVSAASTARMSKGFTIVELLIVVVIIGILAAITIVSYNGMQARVVASSLQSDLSNASKMLKLYQTTHGTYPTGINATTYCPTPADTNYCLKASSGNSFSNYTYNNGSNPPTFSLDATRGATRYFISDSTSPVSPSTTFTMAAITGTPQTNIALNAGARTPAGATVSFQWQRATTSGGTYSNIAGATSSSYTPSADMGYYIRVVATGTGTYSSTVTSAPTTVVRAPLTSVGAPTGTPKVGVLLTAGARVPAAATVTYQWQSNSVNIAGATASTFTPTVTQQGTAIRVIVTGTGNYTGTATSPATAAVAP